MPWYIIPAMIVVFLGVVYLALAFGFAYIILHPKRQPIAESPADVDLKYEQVEFESGDGLNLKGWFVPGRSNKLVLVTHPMWNNRHGYLIKNQSRLAAAKDDVHILLTVKALNEAGYSVLMFDFRNHGQSDGSGTPGCGLHEYRDVIAAMDYLRHNERFNSFDIGFVGFCMGANSMIIAMDKSRGLLDKVKCFVAIQPITLGVFARSYLKNLYSFAGLLLFPMIRVFVRWQGGHDLFDMSPRAYLQAIKIPTLYVQTRTDPWTELSDIEGFYAETAAPKEFWWMEQKMSRLQGYNYVGQHPEKIIQFLKSHL